MNYAFSIHLSIRWFASACNVLMALSLAINLARLEGEKSRRKNSLTTLRIRLVSYCRLCLCGWSVTIWTRSVIPLHIDVLWGLVCATTYVIPFYLLLMAMTVISTTLCKSQQWFWDCDGLHNGHFEFVINSWVLHWAFRIQCRVFLECTPKPTRMSLACPVTPSCGPT
jgi:hypothetical protein